MCEAVGSGREELSRYPPPSSAVLWMVNVCERKLIYKKKMISETLQLVDRITCCTRQYKDGEINESLEVVTEKLQGIMIRNRQQKKITDYFNLWCKINWYITKNYFFFTIPHSHSQIRGGEKSMWEWIQCKTAVP